MDKTGKSKISLWQKTILIILGIFLFFVLLEIGLRLGGFIFLTLQEYRNKVSLMQKGEYRILCLGESTTAAGGKDSYPSQLEEILNQRNIAIKFSVINQDVCAINTLGIQTQLEYSLNKYRPDMVIAMIGMNEVVGHICGEDISILNSFETYKLLKLFWLHIVTKAKEKGIYPAQKAKLQPKPSNIVLRDNIKQTNPIPPEEEFKKAIELNPRNDDAYAGLGEFYKDQGDFVRAAGLFKKALEINPRSDYTYVKLGWFYRDQGDLVQAEGAFKKALELNLRNEGAYLGLGEFYRDQKDFVRAEQAFKKTIELNPRNDCAYTRLGWASKDRGDFTQAEDLFKKAIEINPGNDNAYVGLVALYRAMGKIAPLEECERVTNGVKLNYDILKAYRNYLRLKEILDKKRIKLMCVRYPMRNIAPLRQIFIRPEGILLVESERIFIDAIKKEGYKEYFTDVAGSNLGRCTNKGNRLLAEHTANVILKECFNK
jgi:Flp pilus assembly protein TadD